MKRTKESIIPPLDRGRLLAQYQDFHEGLIDMIFQFNKMAPDVFESMVLSARSRDLAQVALHAHKLKGAASYFYAESVTGLAETIEASGKSVDEFELLALVDKLGIELKSLYMALEEIRKVLNTSSSDEEF